MSVELKPLLMKTNNKPQQGLNRLQSCVTDYQAQALSAFEARDYKAFIDAVSEDGFEPNAEYGEDIPKTLAHTIIEEAEGRDIFLLALVKAGGRTDLRNQILENVPFHEAIRKQDPALLKVCLIGVKDINVQDGEGSTALHIATEGLLGAEESEADNLVDIINILLQVPGVLIDCEDMKGECTPLYYAATAASERAVALLLAQGANHNNNNSGEKIQDIIRQNIPGFDVSSLPKVTGGRPVKNVLFNLIELADNVEGLNNYARAKDNIDWNADNGQFTLLQYAADQGRSGIVGYLLDNGADVNRTATNDTPPIELAAYHGYYKVLGVMFDKLSESDLRRAMVKTDKLHGNRTILHQIVRQHSPKLDNPLRDTNIDFAECIRVLFGEKRKGSGGMRYASYTQRIINFKDDAGETPLHYATQQPNQEIIKLLLKHGANMGVKNMEEKPPVNKILPATLQEFLDDCIVSDGIITDDDLKVTFDYNFLAPPLLDEEILNEFENKKDVESCENSNPRPETEALWYLSESKDHRGLLKHPVISSFLLMKWQRIRTFYLVSLVIYFLFVLSLTLIILVDYGGCSLFTSKECCASLSSKISYAASPPSESTNTSTSADPPSCRADSTVLKVVVGVFLTFLGLIEVLQLAVSVKRYFASVTNYIQIAILVGSATLILNRSLLDWEDRRHLAAVLIVFSWSEFIIMVGQHPSLSTNVTMLYTVVGTFFKFLLWYTAFIVAFAFSFYIMFHTDFPGSSKNEDYVFFDEIGTCIVKTSAMFVGELEFSDIPFSSNPISYILFVAFIFLVVVVLMNLLNGLAVSDTGLIREEAEVLSLKSQVDLISYWESILLNDPYNFLTSWPKFLSALPSFSCCFWVKRIPLLEAALTKIAGGTRILLFYECLPDKSATFYPNSSRVRSCIPYRKRIQVESTGRNSPAALQIRKDVLDAAKTIILDRSSVDEKDMMLMNKLTSLENKLEFLTNTLQTFLTANKQ